MAEAAKEKAGKKIKETIPLKGVRRVVAEHMMRSLRVSAQLSNSGAMDMTEIVKLRKNLLAQEETTGIHYTYTDIFVKVVAQALMQHPIVNSSVIDDEIIVWEDINVGIAMAFELRGGGSGLIVPVVRNADKKSLEEIHHDVSDLVKRGRSLKLLPDDVTGGTFTITNVGVFGAGAKVIMGSGTPILNQPEVAILATTPIVDMPVVSEGKVVVRPMMNFSLTFDHRVVMGEDAVKFIVTLQQIIEKAGSLE